MKKFEIWLLLIGIILILVTPGISAWEFDNVAKLVKNETQVYGTIEIWNAFNLPLIRTKLAEYTLLNNSLCLIDCYAEGTTVLYFPDRLFTSLKFYNIKGEETNLAYTDIFILKEENYTEQIPEYKEVCEEILNNETQELKLFCEDRLSGYKEKEGTRQVYKQYKGEQLKTGSYNWKIAVNKKPNQDVDWILTALGEELEQWAWWDADWKYRKPINITENSGFPPSNYSIMIDTEIPAEMNADCSDLRFTNGSDDMELFYWIKTCNASTLISLVNTPNLTASVNTTIFMYYGNAGASTTSDLKKSAVLGDDFATNTTTKYTPGIGTTIIFWNSTAKWLQIQNPVLHTEDKVSSGYSATLNNFTVATRLKAMTTFTSTQNVGVDYPNNANRWISAGSVTKFYYCDANSCDYNTPYGWDIAGWTEMEVNVSGALLTASSYTAKMTNSTDVTLFTGTTGNAVAGTSTALSIRGYSEWIAYDYVYAIPYVNPSPTYSIGEEEFADSSAITVTLTLPANNLNITDATIAFNATITPAFTNLTNITLWIDDAVSQFDTLADLNYSINYTWTKTLTDGIHNWNVTACGDGTLGSLCGYSDLRNFTVDATAPTTILDFPDGIYTPVIFPYNISLNYTITDDNLDSCWYTLDSGANISLICGTNSSVFVDSGAHTLTLWANDTFSHTGSDTNTFGDDFKIQELNQTSNSSTYETYLENFAIEFTYNTTKYTTVSANLVYNGTNYAGTKQGTGDTINFTRDLNIPPGVNQVQENRTFYWQVNLGGIDTFDSIIRSQVIEPIVYTLCNSTYNIPFINYTIQDENGSIVSGYFDVSTTLYSYDLTVNRSYSFTNNTGNTNYAFCASPVYQTMLIDTEIQYSGTGYPQRRYELDQTYLTNSSTSKTLYLLKTAEGIYSIYQVQTSTGTGLQNVLIKAERYIGGTWVLIEQGTTDSAGAVTFWLDPDYDHRITATKIGYPTFQGIIRPSSSTYTIIMETTETGIADSTIFKGWKWTFHPANGILEKNTIYNFGFNITSNQANIQECKIEILNATAVLNSTTGCNSAGGNISVFLNTSYYNKLWGRFSVKANGTYYILDSDAYWTNIESHMSDTTLTSFFNRLRTLNEFGEDENRQEFTRIVLIFFILMLLLSAISYSTGWDPANPGGMLLILCPIIWGLSLSGLFTLNNISPFDWLDQFFVATIFSLITLGYIGNNIRRNAT